MTWTTKLKNIYLKQPLNSLSFSINVAISSFQVLVSGSQVNYCQFFRLLFQQTLNNDYHYLKKLDFITNFRTLNPQFTGFWGACHPVSKISLSEVRAMNQKIAASHSEALRDADFYGNNVDLNFNYSVSFRSTDC